jgi:hypothetical protein
LARSATVPFQDRERGIHQFHPVEHMGLVSPEAVSFRDLRFPLGDKPAENSLCIGCGGIFADETENSDCVAYQYSTELDRKPQLREADYR